MKIDRLKNLIYLFSCCLIACSGEDVDPVSNPCDDPGTIPLFVEKDGLLVIEAESVAIGTGWSAHTARAGFTGSSYIQWEDANSFSTPGKGLMTYKINIQTPGTYRFQWRSHINEGDNNTESNDAWLRFADAADFYGEKKGNFVYPNGTGKKPNPEGQSKDGWFKIYMNQLDTWSWQARTSDNDAHDIYVVFDSAGIYTMEISGRSKGFALDRIVLYNVSVSTGNATDTAAALSEVDCIN